MKTLKIAFVTSWCLDVACGSGTAVAINELRRSLQSLGHDVNLVTLKKHPALWRRLLFNFTLRSRLDAKNYDVIVCFDWDGFLLPRFTTPVIVSIKGVLADESYFERGWAKIMLGAQAVIEWRNALKASLVVTTSAYSRKRIVAAYGLAEEKVAVVPEGIDLLLWNKTVISNPASKKKRPTILTVAHQYYPKNTAALITALPRVLRVTPDAQLRIVGDGPMFGQLKRQVEKLKLGNKVCLLGTITDSARLRQEYARADVFCLPSFNESFGIVMLEAMAFGLPVVAYRATAMPEVVPDGRAGLLIEPYDENKFTQAIIALLCDKRLRQDLGMYGARHVKNYDWQKIGSRFVSLATSLIKARI